MDGSSDREEFVTLFMYETDFEEMIAKRVFDWLSDEGEQISDSLIDTPSALDKVSDDLTCDILTGDPISDTYFSENEQDTLHRFHVSIFPERTETVRKEYQQYQNLVKTLYNSLDKTRDEYMDEYSVYCTELKQRRERINS
jgi:hypothetical protein